MLRCAVLPASLPAWRWLRLRLLWQATATDLQLAASHQGARVLANGPDIQLDIAASIGGVSALKYLQKQPAFASTLTQRLMSALRQSLVTDGTELLLTSGNVRRTGMVREHAQPRPSPWGGRKEGACII